MLQTPLWGHSVRSPAKPTEAEGEKDVLFFPEIKMLVCGPGKSLECHVFGKKKLGLATALAGKRSHQLVDCSFVWEQG